jgi:NADH-quinone oxidoreductase subunit L
MLVPLLVLAPLAFAGGLIETPFSERGRFLEHWLEPVVHFGEAHVHQSTGVKVSLALIAVAAGILGIALAAAVYLRKRTDLAAKIEKPIFAKGWMYDATITSFMGGPGRKAFEAIAWFDKTVVDGAVNGVGALVRESSGRARLVQTGYVRNYALGIAFGAVVLTVLLLTQAVY